MSSKQGLGSSTTSNGVHSTSTTNTTQEKSYFEQQRELLVRDIGVSMEQVLQNINKLNRSLEGIISVGNEFSSVEALWSHFENVMAKEADTDSEQTGAGTNTEERSEGEATGR